MGEPYRTLLDHFRHEIGHYYWDRLVRDGGNIENCRAIFGDESNDYETALKRYYAEGAPAAWQQSFVSAYATTHPWEDFAETFAHYLHIIDSWRLPAPLASASHPRLVTMMCCTSKSISILIMRAASISLATPGFRSRLR